MKVNVVITGAVRDYVDLFLIIEAVDKAKKSGIVDQVILSTWKEEFSDFYWIKKLLLKSGVFVVENEPMLDGGVGNISRQQRAFYAGLLNIVDKNKAVIKCRTDKCRPTLEYFLKYAEITRQLDVDESCVFSRKIVVEMASMSVPFLIADKVFLASYYDALKLTMSYDIFDKDFAFGKHLGAENRWFSGLFLLKYPDYRYYFGKANFRAISTCVTQSIVEKNKLPDGFSSFFSNYFTALDKSFSFVKRQNDKNRVRFDQGKNFLIEKRLARSEIHIKTQEAMNFIIDEYPCEGPVDFSIFTNFFAKNWLGKIIVSPPEGNEEWGGDIFKIFPVSNDAISALNLFWREKGFSNLSAADIYYESAHFFLNRNIFYQDAISLLKKGFKSKHIPSGKILHELNEEHGFLDEKDSAELKEFLKNRGVIL